MSSSNNNTSFTSNVKNIIHDTLDYIHLSTPRIRSRTTIQERFNARPQIGRLGANVQEDSRVNDVSQEAHAQERSTQRRLPSKRDTRMIPEVYSDEIANPGTGKRERRSKELWRKVFSVALDMPARKNSRAKPFSFGEPRPAGKASALRRRDSDVMFHVVKNWDDSEINNAKPNEASAEPVPDKEDVPRIPEEEERCGDVDEEEPKVPVIDAEEVWRNALNGFDTPVRETPRAEPFSFGEPRPAGKSPALRRHESEVLFGTIEGREEARNDSESGECKPSSQDEDDEYNEAFVESMLLDEEDIAPVLEDERGHDEREEIRADKGKKKAEFPVADVVNDDSGIKVGNLLPPPSKTLKRTRSALEGAADKDDFERFDTPEDELPPPKKLRRSRRLANERRKSGVEGTLVTPLREALRKNVGLFASRARPTSVRLMSHCEDGLDDAPTPPDTPPRRRRRN